jgi:hypothetical protein
MNCQQVEELLPLLVDEEDLGLDRSEREQVLAHLQSCPLCQEELRLLRETVAALSYLQAVDPPPQLRQGVMTRIRRQERLRLRSLRRALLRFLGPRSVLRFAAVAASLAVLVTSYSVFRTVGRAPSSSDLFVLDRDLESTQALPPAAAPAGPAQPMFETEAAAQSETDEEPGVAEPHAEPPSLPPLPAEARPRLGSDTRASGQESTESGLISGPDSPDAATAAARREVSSEPASPSGSGYPSPPAAYRGRRSDSADRAWSKERPPAPTPTMVALPKPGAPRATAVLDSLSDDKASDPGRLQLDQPKPDQAAQPRQEIEPPKSQSELAAALGEPASAEQLEALGSLSDGAASGKAGSDPELATTAGLAGAGGGKTEAAAAEGSTELVADRWVPVGPSTEATRAKSRRPEAQVPEETSRDKGPGDLGPALPPGFLADFEELQEAGAKDLDPRIELGLDRQGFPRFLRWRTGVPASLAAALRSLALRHGLVPVEGDGPAAEPSPGLLRKKVASRDNR